MRRLLPYPALAAGLLAAWLLLGQGASAGGLVMGALLSLAATRALVPLEPPAGRARRPRTALRLAGTVLAEIVRSNIAVARIVLRLGKGRRERRSGFVRIPLEMRAPYGLAALACIITATPGTVWVEYDSSDGTMLLHVLDLIEEEEWVRIVKDRYEGPLMEIFG